MLDLELFLIDMGKVNPLYLLPVVLAVAGLAALGINLIVLRLRLYVVQRVIDGFLSWLPKQSRW